MDLLADAVIARQGWFSRADALAANLTDRELAIGVRQRRFVRLRHGAYCPTQTYERCTDAERHLLLARAVVAAQRGRVALTGASAAALHGLAVWGQDLDTVSVVRLDAGTARLQASCRHHVVGSAVEDDLEVRDGMLTTNLARTVWEVARTSTLEAAVSTTDSALATDPRLAETLARMGSRFEHHPGSRTARIALRMADGGSQSPGESITRVQCYRFGIPRPVLQHEVRDSNGKLLGVSDFWWPEYRHLGEFDGKVKYQQYLRAGESPADAVFREKRREDAMRALRCGMTRFTWADVMPDHARSTMAKLWQDLQQSRRLYAG
ncbi:MAG TPA: type IV toxin-antitoxin system AbiEi family antitoxin domain-containing protein [Propionibacteriaceae bacterium]|nr:type IV toxin-antitoxin system AbiEi family antitoxin domain-containing protein [Propionibacteriaceae bacterium]